MQTQVPAMGERGFMDTGVSLQQQQQLRMHTANADKAGEEAEVAGWGSGGWCCSLGRVPGLLRLQSLKKF